MALYLVQHGKNLAKEQDPDKGLSPQGRSEVERIANVAKGYAVTVSTIKHSGAKRALETAEIFADALKPPQGLQEISGIAPLDDVTRLRPNAGDNVMLVGHLPFMERLTSYLTTGSEDNTVFKFQNGGIVCLDEDVGKRSWHIKWALMPNIG